MHLYFFLRGNYPVLEIWKTLAQSQFWKWKRIDLATGKEDFKLVQGALRPSVMGAYEYVFPEEALAEVLSVFGVTNDGIPAYDKFLLDKMRMSVLRKIFRCKAIPKSVYKKALEIPNSIMLQNSERGLSHLKIPGACVHIIGIKEDKKGEFFHHLEAPTGYEQEML